MNENDDAKKDLKNASAAELESELEKRIEKKAEQWGSGVEKKIDNFEKKIPAPLNALGDAVCISVVIAAGAWVCKKLGWINDPPSLTALGITFVVVLVLSLIYRLLIKPKCGK